MTLLIILFIFPFILGVFTYFLWWCMGSPDVKNNEVDSKLGRVFSSYGNFVVRKYSEYEQKETARIKPAAEKEFQEYNRKTISTVKDMIADGDSDETCIRYQEKRKADIFKLQRKHDARRKLNPWKIGGACFRCFSTWFTFAVYVAGCSFLFIDGSISIFLTVTLFFMIPISPITGSLLIKHFRDA